jgi:hypothetical protein
MAKKGIVAASSGIFGVQARLCQDFSDSCHHFSHMGKLIVEASASLLMPN